MENLGTILKDLRDKCGYTGKEVSAELLKYGYEISDKTIYNYEKGIRMPNADIFMELCHIYGCKNILETFCNVEIDKEIPDDREWGIIRKYRDLDEHGKELVDTVLEREWNRSTTPKETVTVFSIPYAYDLAASAGTGEYAMDIAHFENVGITQKPPKGANFLIRVSGNSMEPEYFDNDKVFVKRMDDVDDGEIGLFFLDGDVYIKEKNANGLRSLNPDYQIIPVNEYSSIKCYGKIIGKCDCDITEI